MVRRRSPLRSAEEVSTNPLPRVRELLLKIRQPTTLHHLLHQTVRFVHSHLLQHHVQEQGGIHILSGNLYCSSVSGPHNNLVVSQGRPIAWRARRHRKYLRRRATALGTHEKYSSRSCQGLFVHRGTPYPSGTPKVKRTSLLATTRPLFYDSGSHSRCRPSRLEKLFASTAPSAGQPFGRDAA